LVGSEVVHISAVGVPVISDKVDIANARLTFESGCVANVTSSRVTMKQTRKIRIFQHNAYISLDFAHQKIVICKRIEEEGLPRPRVDYREIAVTKKDALEEELGAFISSVISRAEPVVTGSDGRMALDVALKVQKGAMEWEGIPKMFL
jgi:predicted dehydrogenase